MGYEDDQVALDKPEVADGGDQVLSKWLHFHVFETLRFAPREYLRDTRVPFGLVCSVSAYENHKILLTTQREYAVLAGAVHGS